MGGGGAKQPNKPPAASASASAPAPSSTSPSEAPATAVTPTPPPPPPSPPQLPVQLPTPSPSPSPVDTNEREPAEQQPAKRASVRKSVSINSNVIDSPSAPLNSSPSVVPNKHLDELSRRSSIRKSGAEDSLREMAAAAVASTEIPLGGPIGSWDRSTGPKKLTAQEIERFHLDEEIGSVSTSRNALVGTNIKKSKTYAVRSFSAPLGHPDHDAQSLVAEDKKAQTNVYFDPQNLHLAPPSALHRMATKMEQSGMSVVERAPIGRPTILTDTDYQPPLSSVSVQYPMGIINPSHANGTGDAARLASGLTYVHGKRDSPRGDVETMKVKIGSSIQAQYEARQQRDEHPLRAILRAHTVAPNHYKKGTKLLKAVASLNFSMRSGAGTDGSTTSESLAGTWPPTSPTQASECSGYSGFSEGKEDRDRHRMETKSSDKKKNGQCVVVPLNSPRNKGFK